MLLVSGAADSALTAAHHTACDFFYVYIQYDQCQPGDCTAL